MRARRREDFVLRGAQGVLLDVDHGTLSLRHQPPTPSAARRRQAAGLAPISTGYVLGIVKSLYHPASGSGPFPTELEDDIGQRLGERGHEFGPTVTGGASAGSAGSMPWLVRQSCAISGVTGIALTKIDVFGRGWSVWRICTGYSPERESLYDYLPSHCRRSGRMR